MSAINFELLPENQLKREKDSPYTRIVDGPMQGTTVLSSNGQIVSRSFGQVATDTFTATGQTFTEAGEQRLLNPNNRYIAYGQGAHVWTWSDHFNTVYRHFSNKRNLDARNSSWVDPTEKFGDLFVKGGGPAFDEALEKIPGATNNYMLITGKLMYSTKADLRGNEVVVKYLGTVLLDGTVVNLSFPSSVGCQNYTIPTADELRGRVFVPMPLETDQVIPFLTQGYGFGPESVVEQVVDENGNITEIRKIMSQGMLWREQFLGNKPNVKNYLYTFFDNARFKNEAAVSAFEEKFGWWGCPTDEQLNELLESPLYAQTIPVEWANPVDHSKFENAIRSLLCLYILCCPVTKQKIAIQSLFDYLEDRKRIKKFVSRHNADLRQGKYDELLTSFHKEKPLSRLKDMATRSHAYAQDKSKRGARTYKQNMEFSLDGLVKNEYGHSFYGISKCLDLIQKNDEKKEKELVPQAQVMKEVEMQ